MAQGFVPLFLMDQVRDHHQDTVCAFVVGEGDFNTVLRCVLNRRIEIMEQEGGAGPWTAT